MSASGAQADAFYEEVLSTGRVWTLRDAHGFPAPVNREGDRTMPFWSKRSRAEHVVTGVPAYSAFEIVEIRAEEWRLRWLPGLKRDGILVGVNWSGDRATGFDTDADDLGRNLNKRDID